MTRRRTRRTLDTGGGEGREGRTLAGAGWQLRFRVGAVALSLGVHLALLTLASRLPLLDGGWPTGDEGAVPSAPFFLQLDPVPMPPAPPPPAPGAFPQPPSLLLPSPSAAGGDVGPIHLSALVRPLTSASPAAARSFSLASPVVGATGLAPGFMMSRSSGGGLGGAGIGLGPARIDLFGVASEGRRFYFLIDVSGSMISPPNSVEGFTRLEIEVARALDTLPPGCSFGLLIFSRVTERFRETLAPAFPDSKRQALEWFKSRSPTAFLNDPEGAGRRFTETRMLLAFANAMRERPDVIYLVSDGEPTDIDPAELLSRIEKWQKARAGSRIVIHAISYGAANDRFMQEVARRNNGTFLRIAPVAAFR